ncbi:MAG: hypothetical protein ABSA46_17095 [Thermodesulfovibrionales bacterium]|jgi:hypothetical protein
MIITDERGLTFVHFLKEELVRCDQVTSVSISDNILIGNVAKGKSEEVKTRERSYKFPLTMKEKGQVFPIFGGTVGNFWWKDEHGNKLPIDSEHCPLFIEIQRHIKNEAGI